jgi:L-iditol 2-dehydrogenase
MECSYCEQGHYPACSNIHERLPGGFAQYILVPEVLVERGTYLLPENMTYDQSTFIEPLACVVRAQNLAGIREGQTVLVMGCGMSGLLHVKLARSKKCRIIATDLNKKRLEIAKTFDANLAVQASENIPGRLMAEYGRKADAVILCTSALSAVDQAWESVDRGGSIVFFAVPGPEKKVTVPINEFWTKEIKIVTSYYCGPPDIAEAMKLIAARTIDVEDMITHRLPLEDVAKGFRYVIEGKESLKVIIRPNNRTET